MRGPGIGAGGGGGPGDGATAAGVGDGAGAGADAPDATTSYLFVKTHVVYFLLSVKYLTGSSTRTARLSQSSTARALVHSSGLFAAVISNSPSPAAFIDSTCGLLDALLAVSSVPFRNKPFPYGGIKQDPLNLGLP